MAVGQLWRANRTNRTRFAVTSVEGHVCLQASPGDRVQATASSGSFKTVRISSPVGVRLVN